MDLYIEVKGTSHKLYVESRHGDVTREKTDAVVVFRTDVGNRFAGESSKVLKLAGDSVEAEYQDAKRTSGTKPKDKQKNVTVTKAGNCVILTEAGDLPTQKYILHVNMASTGLARIQEVIISALRLAEKNELRSVAFSSTSSLQFVGESREDMAKKIMEALEDFVNQYKPLCLHSIVMNDDDSPIYRDVLRYERLHTSSGSSSNAKPSVLLQDASEDQAMDEEAIGAEAWSLPHIRGVSDILKEFAGSDMSTENQDQ